MSRDPVSLPTSAFIFRNLTASGFWLTEWIAGHSSDRRREMINEILDLSRSGRFVAPDCLEIPWSRENSIIEEMLDEKNQGKKIIIVNN
jgi:trans-2-enoyl-CoA reductase